MLIYSFGNFRMAKMITIGLLGFTSLTQSFSALGQTPPPVFPRQNINAFMTQPARIDALRRGIQVMKQRPASNPTSWAFQSNVHGTTLSNPNWNQCQHRHWWFLAWHRAYLYYMERMLQRAANEPRLRIPYWNYTATNSRSLPAPFRDPSSSLFVAGRSLVSATDQLAPSAVSITTAMSRTAFIGSNAQLGFGGGRENAPVQFPFENKAGSLEVLPHNAIHVQVGGLMANPNTSATDPIFWLHHSNIDRLWVNWLASGGGRANPTDTAFLNATFRLYNENGVLVTHRVRDFIGSTARLGYYYDDSPPPTAASIAAATATQPPAQNNNGASDMNMVFTTIGEATVAEPTPILAQPVTLPITINMQMPAAQTLRTQSSKTPGKQPCRYWLVLEDIGFDKPPSNIYELFLGQPNATVSSSTQLPTYIGVLSFFEPYPLNHNNHAHHDTTRSNTFDITNNIRSLQKNPKFDPSQITLTVVPTGIMKRGKLMIPDKPVPMTLKTIKIVAGETRPNPKTPAPKK